MGRLVQLADFVYFGGMRPRSYFGWGYADESVGQEERARLVVLLSPLFDVSALCPLSPRPIEEVSLAAPRFSPPSALRELFSTAPFDRASHCYGKSYRDLVRALSGDFQVAPDAVARPRDEDDVAALLDWCGGAGVAVVPYGGGSSVVGGVEARFEGYRGALSLDLGRLSGVREIDITSRAARIGAGTLGPDLEAALKPHGLALRHYPQSFEFSTLGGWLATRAGGHFATLYTRIDDLCEALEVVTPAGRFATRRLPSSGAGPQPERLWLGSEGALGVITGAWMRVQALPAFRAAASYRFGDFYQAAEAARRIAQAQLFPANCRLLDPVEAMINGLGDGASSFLLIAFEGADHPLEPWLARAAEIARAQGGEEQPAREQAGGVADRWKKAFLRAPYVRDAIVQLGVIVETFETAVTWDRFESFHRALIETARTAAERICGAGLIASRVTHVYPDGAAPYFTVLAPARAGSHLSQWDEIKAAVSEAILAHGGTITHHHAVGRDHRPWYDRERPEVFAAALRACKRALDPAGILNPGVLIPAEKP